MTMQLTLHCTETFTFVFTYIFKAPASTSRAKNENESQEMISIKVTLTYCFYYFIGENNFTLILQDIDYINLNKRLADWPNVGEIKFIGYSATYRKDLALALEDVNLTINGGEKVKYYLLCTCSYITQILWADFGVFMIEYQVRRRATDPNMQCCTTNSVPVTSQLKKRLLNRS